MVGEHSSSRSCEQSGYSKQFAHLDPFYSCRAMPYSSSRHVTHDRAIYVFSYYLFRIQDIWYLCTRVIYIQNLRWPCIDWTRFQSSEASHCGWAAKIPACLEGACAVQDIQSKRKRHQYTWSKNMSRTFCSCMYLNDICNYLILFCIVVYFHIHMYIYAYLYLCMHAAAGVPWETTSQATSEQHPKNVWMHIYHIKRNGVSLACQCWFKRPGCHCRSHAVIQSSIICQISWYFTCIYV